MIFSFQLNILAAARYNHEHVTSKMERKTQIQPSGMTYFIWAPNPTFYYGPPEDSKLAYNSGYENIKKL